MKSNGKIWFPSSRSPISQPVGYIQPERGNSKGERIWRRKSAPTWRSTRRHQQQRERQKNTCTNGLSILSRHIGHVQVPFGRIPAQPASEIQPVPSDFFSLLPSCCNRELDPWKFFFFFFFFLWIILDGKEMLPAAIWESFLSKNQGGSARPAGLFCLLCLLLKFQLWEIEVKRETRESNPESNKIK